MRITSPAYLLLLPAVFWLWRARAGRNTAAVVVRCAIAALLILAMCGLEIHGGSSPLSIMFVADQSASVLESGWNAAKAVTALSTRMQSGDRAGVIVFGADAAVERRLGAEGGLTSIAAGTSSVDTDIEEALRLARAGLGSGTTRRIVLLSDGLETRGRALTEAVRAGSDGIPIDVALASLPNERTRSLAVTRVAAPPAARVREPVRIAAVVQGAPGTRAEVTLAADGGERQTRQVTLPADGVAAVEFEASHDRAGLYTYRAEARDPADQFGATSNEAGAVISVSGQPRVLYAGTGDFSAIPLLESAGFQVTRTTAQNLSTAALPSYDAVVLDDIASDTLGREQDEALLRYVEGGGGLLVLGGPRSLAPGVPIDDPLRRLLPVDLRPRSGRRTPAAALVVVFDRSGSMDDRVGGTTKIQLAREAVRRALEAVGTGDAVGVIGFSDKPAPVVPLGSDHDPADVASRLRALRAEGPTAITPAIELAAAWLRGQDAARRHLLLVSDGRTSPADAARAQAAVRAGGFELTAVALGSGSDRGFLTTLADATGGRAYFPEDLRQLPSILAREAARVAGGGIVQEPFVARTAPHPVLAGIAASGPRLGGYVVAAAKPSAETALRSHLDDPILSTWQFGLGRVGVYTADLHSAWSAGLRSWPGFTRMMQQTTRWLSRRVEDRDLYARIDTADDGRPRLLVEAPDATAVSRPQLDVRATVRSPSGQTLELVLRESSPGTYEAVLPFAMPGAYGVTIAAQSADRMFSAAMVRGFYWSAAREHERRGIDRELLSSVAAASGGRILAQGASAFDAPREPQYRGLQAPLALAALLLFFGERLAPALSYIRGRSRRRRAAVTFEEAA